jgi:hypothetical protein
MMKMSKIVLLATLFSLSGCLHERHSGYVIPARCMKVSVQSFTQPCVQRLDGKFVCDGVVITANCLLPRPVEAVR